MYKGRAPLHFHLSFSSHWYTFYLLIYRLVYSTIYFSTSLVTVRTKTTIENKMSETTERHTHSLYCLGVATIWVFFIILLNKIYITTGEYIFLISISNLTLLALTLMFVSESYNAIESQIYQELPHLELKRCMNCKYLILQLNVSFWVIWQETTWFSSGSLGLYSSVLQLY